MASYSVAEAKNNLPTLIDKAIEGEEVVITRHGKPVAELRPRTQRDAKSAKALTEWLLARRDARPGVDITSVELLSQIYEEDDK
jgi:prevent-host-death family protein